MNAPASRPLAGLAALVMVGLLAGCGYERYPVRVRPDVPEPGDTAPFGPYGLRVSPPWPDGGLVLLSYPDSVRVEASGKTLISRDDLTFVLPCPRCAVTTFFAAPAGSAKVRCVTCDAGLPVLKSYRHANRWEIAPNERTATLDLDSPGSGDIHLRIDVTVEGPRMDFALTIENRSADDLGDLSATFAADYGKLLGFALPDAGLQRAFVLVKGNLTSLSRLRAPQPWVPTRTVLAKDVSPAEPPKALGNLSPTPIDRALVILTDADGKRKVLITWQPGELVSIDGAAATLHVNPHLGSLSAGQSVRVHGLILFGEGSIPELLARAANKSL